MQYKKTMSDRSLTSNGSIGMETFKLEALAEVFQEQLHAEQLVKKQKVGSKSVPNSFRGQDAVTVLKDILQSQRLSPEDSADELTLSTSPVTREEALEAGREIAKVFRFFVDVNARKNKENKDYGLEDSEKNIYVFHNNLPIQVHKMKKKHPSPWDRVKVLEEQVEVQDRRSGLRSINQCFVASEAVDILMKLNLVKSRKEGVHVMQKMNDKVKFFKLANAPADKAVFKDDKQLFLQFVPKEDRVTETKEVPRGRGDTDSVEPRSRSTSPKDKAYFVGRAKDIRSGLGQFHQQRMSGGKQKVNVTSAA